MAAGPPSSGKYVVSKAALQERVFSLPRLSGGKHGSEVVKPAACWLARCRADIHVRAVTEKQQEVQEARIKRVLARYASHPKVGSSSSSNDSITCGLGSFCMLNNI